MKRLSDGLGPTQDPDQRPDPRPEPTETAPEGIKPGEAQPSLDPPSELDERFKKCPWLFKKGNTTGAHRQKRSQVRLRMENLIQRLTDNGDVIVQFFCAVASGQPFMMRYVEKLPRTPEQEAVAQGIATPEQKAAAGGAQERQARSQRLERPHERQQRHALSNPNDKMDPIRKRDLPTWAKSANAREHDLLLFYRWRRRWERYGADGVHPRRQSAGPGRPNRPRGVELPHRLAAKDLQRNVDRFRNMLGFVFLSGQHIDELRAVSEKLAKPIPIDLHHHGDTSTITFDVARSLD